jgi:hypothetical protein
MGKGEMHYHTMENGKLGDANGERERGPSMT